MDQAERHHGHAHIARKSGECISVCRAEAEERRSLRHGAGLLTSTLGAAGYQARNGRLRCQCSARRIGITHRENRGSQTNRQDVDQVPLRFLGFASRPFRRFALCHVLIVRCAQIIASWIRLRCGLMDALKNSLASMSFKSRHVRFARARRVPELRRQAARPTFHFEGENILILHDIRGGVLKTSIQNISNARRKAVPCLYTCMFRAASWSASRGRRPLVVSAFSCEGRRGSMEPNWCDSGDPNHQQVIRIWPDGGKDHRCARSRVVRGEMLFSSVCVQSAVPSTAMWVSSEGVITCGDKEAGASCTKWEISTGRVRQAV